MSGKTVFAIVLAAGRASRFGSVKQLALYRGRPLVAHAIRHAEAVCAERTILVTGHRGNAVYAAAAPLRGFRVQNSEYAGGLASSIASGIAAAAGAADGVLLMLADQPLIDRRHLETLIDAWQTSPEDIIASGYAGKTGVPALFPRRCFDELRALSGDSGARKLLTAAGGRLRTVPFEDAAVDVDRPADLKALQARER